MTAGTCRIAAIRWCSVIALAYGALAGCDWLLGKELNPEYCAAHRDDIDCRPDAPKRCSTSAECTAPLVCNASGTMTCVECTPEEPAACVGDMPICGDGNRCRGCSAHAECPGSNACLPEGRCAAPDEVAYVQDGGMGTMPCAKEAPCGRLREGVMASRPYIKIADTLADTLETTINGRAVTILANPGAKLDRTGDGPILIVQGANANVSIYDLEITGQTTGSPTEAAIQLVPNGGSPMLTLVRVKVTGGQGRGIAASGGMLTVSRSTISGNGGGGIAVMGAQFDITNNIIVRNGDPTSLVGGIDLQGIPGAGARRVEFNTIAGNVGNTNVNSGINCGTVVAAVTFSSNIIYGNIVSGTGKQIGGDANCLTTYSDIGPDAVSGAGNINADPMFVNAQNDFHLQPQSPPRDRADPAATLAIDIDGEPRPQGAVRDMGADEVR